MTKHLSIFFASFLAFNAYALTDAQYSAIIGRIDSVASVVQDGNDSLDVLISRLNQFTQNVDSSHNTTFLQTVWTAQQNLNALLVFLQNFTTDVGNFPDSYFAEVYGYLRSIGADCQNLVTAIDTANTTLGTISYNVQDIALDLQTISPNVDDIRWYTESINTTITDMYARLGIIQAGVSSISNNVENVSTDLSTFLLSFETYTNSFKHNPAALPQLTIYRIPYTAVSSFAGKSLLSPNFEAQVQQTISGRATWGYGIYSSVADIRTTLSYESRTLTEMQWRIWDVQTNLTAQTKRLYNLTNNAQNAVVDAGLLFPSSDVRPNKRTDNLDAFRLSPLTGDFFVDTTTLLTARVVQASSANTALYCILTNLQLLAARNAPVDTTTDTDRIETELHEAQPDKNRLLNATDGDYFKFDEKTDQFSRHLNFGNLVSMSYLPQFVSIQSYSWEFGEFHVDVPQMDIPTEQIEPIIDLIRSIFRIFWWALRLFFIYALFRIFVYLAKLFTTFVFGLTNGR